MLKLKFTAWFEVNPIFGSRDIAFQISDGPITPLPLNEIFLNFLFCFFSGISRNVFYCDYLKGVAKKMSKLSEEVFAILIIISAHQKERLLG